MYLFVHFSTLSTFIVTTGWRVDDFPMTFTWLLLPCDRVSSLPEPSCMNLSYSQMCHIVPFGACLPSLVSWQPILATITRSNGDICLWWEILFDRQLVVREIICCWVFVVGWYLPPRKWWGGITLNCFKIILITQRLFHKLGLPIILN